ncbi:tRNA (cytosine34-C5)-methyltransferase [Trypanosoma rangeli]|uniref:tRNA (Cytosine34-C5)-methyltransferase n=1 Tax=Trypanosoma rangeli TaxID=5698 RepID=A0A3R7NNX1_TRYRA|nr:tRNA (cytosine34-C5)-methyltransferase [Trypanosoma rangeli]RNF05417.1 tRNA (cytosine34-C5)-methyltransferase [Trypanosoma rangeli]|eukprot:RNF05417.1 tRNA (cytosine34-C5)-methyltransferase [Trypanosoma rangeli]
MTEGHQQQPQQKKKLKSFGKNRREVRTKAACDENGNWLGMTHQDTLRQIPCPALDRYYRDLQSILTPAEWDAELSLFRQPLPTTVWINDTDPLAGEVRRYFESLHRSLVEPISWYPLPGMAWRVLAGKTEFRKRPEMQALRRFMIQQTALGTISRQEEVSMLPPFLLDIQPTDKCLDMCASPGSKTAQMLVALGRHKVVPADSNASPFPFDYESEGLVVANDLDTKRANMLVHQVKRLRLLFPFALFTNHDARYFPNVNSSTPSVGNENGELRFDKILCDVVCSGDGTLRKAPYVFKIWSPREAITLQKMQIQIALRACHLGRVGGRVVYSTCSMNPIENEAVVAQIVHRTRGAMKLVDARSLLPGLQCAPGLQRWVVTNCNGEVVEGPSEEAHEALFPPKTPGAYTSDDVDDLDLRLCMRLYPSHCGGGAFFIAVLDKVKEFRLTKREECEAAEGNGQKSHESRKSGSGGDSDGKGILAGKKRAGNGEEEVGESEGVTRKKRVPPTYVTAPSPITDVVGNFYKVKGFPLQQLVVRTATGQRELKISDGSTCSIVSSSALDVLRMNTNSLLVVSAGLRVFARENLDKGWRIASESATLFAKVMQQSPRLLRVPVSFVEQLLSGGKLKDVLFTDIDDAGLRTRLESMEVGTVLLEIDCPSAVGGVFYSVALRARTRLQLLVDHEDVVGLRLRLGIAAEPTVDEPVAVV